MSYIDVHHDKEKGILYVLLPDDMIPEFDFSHLRDKMVVINNRNIAEYMSLESITVDRYDSPEDEALRYFVSSTKYGEKVLRKMIAKDKLGKVGYFTNPDEEYDELFNYWDSYITKEGYQKLEEEIPVNIKIFDGFTIAYIDIDDNEIRDAINTISMYILYGAYCVQVYKLPENYDEMEWFDDIEEYIIAEHPIDSVCGIIGNLSFEQIIDEYFNVDHNQPLTTK